MGKVKTEQKLEISFYIILAISEVDYKVKFAKQYLKNGFCEFDVLNQVDILLKNKKENYILYIESKRL